MKTITTLGLGFLVAAMTTLVGCASAEADTADDDITSDPDGIGDEVGAIAGDNAPLELTKLEIPFPLDPGKTTINLADALKKWNASEGRPGTSELVFAGGKAKVSLNPSSSLSITGAGVKGAIQYTQAATKRRLSHLEGSIYAKATSNVQVDVEFADGFSGETAPREFKMQLGTPLEKTYELKWESAGVRRTLPVNYTVTTSAVFGCSLKANGAAKASFGAQVDLDLEGGLRYSNADGGIPKLADISLIGTPPESIVTVKPGLDGPAGKTFVKANGNLSTTATCYVRPEIEVNFFHVVAFAAGMPASLEASFGADALAVQRNAGLDASLDASWAIDRKLELVAWGSVGFGTAQIVKTNDFKLGSLNFDKPLAAGNYNGEMSFQAWQ